MQGKNSSMSRPRRMGGLALAGALGLATVTFTAAPASAAAYTGQVIASNTFSTSGGGSCSITSGGNGNQTLPFNSPATQTLTQNNSAVATDSGEPADITNMSGSSQGTVTMTEVGGALKTVDMTATLSTTVQPVQGAATDCDSSATSTFATAGTLVVPAPSILDLTAKLRGGRSGNLTFVLTKTTAPASTTVGVDLNQNGKTRRVLALPAGTYTFTALGSSSLTEPETATDPTSDTVNVALHGVLSAPGSALSKAKGTGVKYLKLPDTLNCAAHSVTGDFTKKAGKKATRANGLKPRIKKATFFVNGVKKATKSKPHKNTNVTLSGLDNTDEVAVEVLLKLQDGSKVDIRRTYLPCS